MFKFGPHYLHAVGNGLRRCQLLILNIFNCLAVMFLRRHESFQWIRRRFARSPGSTTDCRHANNNNSSSSTSNGDVTTSNGRIEDTSSGGGGARQPGDVACAESGSVSVMATSTAPRHESNSAAARLDEVVVLVVTTTTTTTMTTTMPSDTKIVKLIGDTPNEVDGGGQQRAAPIAREEDDDDAAADVRDEPPQQAIAAAALPDEVDATATVSEEPHAAASGQKSRVRSYLRKCKERLTGQPPPPPSQPQPPQPLQPPPMHAHHSQFGRKDSADLSAGQSEIAEEAANARAAAPQQEGLDGDEERRPTERVRTEQLKGAVDLAALIDSYLGHIYPVYWAATRAILLQQAREVLRRCYSDSLASFEEQFLGKFAQIARELRERHRLGEKLLWCEGWPLATLHGELILHMGGLDNEAQLTAGDLYLCVKVTKEDQEPNLYAVWRNTTVPVTATTTKSTTTTESEGERVLECRLKVPSASDSDPTEHLSVITIETMLSDELPQLLQNLLVGVERTIGRIALNEAMKMPHDGVAPQPTGGGRHQNDCASDGNGNNDDDGDDGDGESDDANNNNNATSGNSNISASNNNNSNSPKCNILRRSGVTAGGGVGGKLMLRRLTTRQDSMNSTSSGQSCSSGSSTASSTANELMMAHYNHNNSNNNKSKHYAANNGRTSCGNSNNTGGNNNNKGFNSSNNSGYNNNIGGNNNNKGSNNIGGNNNKNIGGNNNNIGGNTNTSSGSPALPFFCLGNSFPHIDSDEENGDSDKRQSLESDDFQLEVSVPTSVLDIPEKLLMSGIQLPGTRDLKGCPLVVVDAASVMQASLNCYEIATVLMYYSSMVERQESHETSMLPAAPPTQPQQSQPEQQQPQQQVTPPSSFAILIAVENSHHLCVIDLICQSLKLLTKRLGHCAVYAVCLDRQMTLPSAAGRSGANKLHDNHKNAVTNTTAAAAGNSDGNTDGTGNINNSNNNNNNNSNSSGGNTYNNNNSNSSGGNTYNNSSSDNSTRLAKSLTAINCTADGDKPRAESELAEHHQPPHQQYSLQFISVDEVTTSVAPPEHLPCGKLQGSLHHDPRKWREFFMQLEPLQRQCSAAAERLCAAMSDIRSSDQQGLTSRRQLYAQHRALSRALMDSELHNLRKRGAAQLQRLHEMARSLQEHSVACKVNTINNNGGGGSHSGSTAANNHNPNRSIGSIGSNIGVGYISSHRNVSIKPNLKTNGGNDEPAGCSRSVLSGGSGGGSNSDIAIRLHKVTLLFNEVDRAAKRLEQLTEQRRERLRQRALEDEINEVTSWISSDGSETLQRFAQVQLDCEVAVKEHEQEFEKYYFISMKHLAKGRDLHEAAAQTQQLHETAAHLKAALDCFAAKLESARERIEGASRLHHLLDESEAAEAREASVQQEIERLAEQCGVSPSALVKYRRSGKEPSSSSEPLKPRTKRTKPPMAASTPTTRSQRLVNRASSGNSSLFDSSASRTGGGVAQPMVCHCWDDVDVDDEERLNGGRREGDDGDEDDEDGDCEEQQSKIADSGLGVGCEHCEGNLKMTRMCSCQSLNEAANMYDKGDDLDDECFERPSKRYQDIHSPLEANAHLQCHASSLELPSKLDQLSCLDQKIQKTLLLIIREMIGTERDYVRSLYYVIENYVDELLRDDIPQPLRGQRNVIFGNIEKIFEFHNSHFLGELERYERHPLKVGAAFLHMESKFYLYALYNKNKPKSDTLMSEYGTAFFKSKQLELNDKMDLASYLLKPVQRMGKYALLLQQLVKACHSVQGSALQEISTDVEELQRAEEMVKFQLRHGNDLLAMDSLRDCDVNVKEQGRLLRQNEFLVWQGRGGKKSLRQIFLFEELVLFSKARRFPDHKNLDIYIYKNSIKTSDIGLTAHVGDSPTKFEIWFRKRKPEDTWTLQCMSEDIKNAWTEEISKLLWKQAKRNREIRLAEMSSMGIGSKPCLDIRPSNNQINDRSITITQLGKAPKLRHSFVGQPSDAAKSTRRPNSLISESSISSGTSSSSLSTGSSSGHERITCQTSTHAAIVANMARTSGHGLELINETQTLTLEASSLPNASEKVASGRNHKRSTTIVSQLSMESGILSDMSITPEQEHQSLPIGGVTRRLKASATLQRNEEPSAGPMQDEHTNPYLHDKREETVINL